jgi:hypothetical protein
MSNHKSKTKTQASLSGPFQEKAQAHDGPSSLTSQTWAWLYVFIFQRVGQNF